MSRTLSALLLGTMIALPAFAADKPTPRQEIRAFYQQYVRAYIEGDANALQGLLDSDYTWRAPKGEALGREQWLARWKQDRTSLRGVVLSINLDRVRFQKDRATVNQTWRLTGTTTDATGALRKVELRSTAQELCVRGSDGWKVRRHETLSENRMVEGAPAKGTPAGVSD